MDNLSSSVFASSGRGEPSWTTLEIQGSQGNRDPVSSVPIKVIEENPGGTRRIRAKKPKVKTGCKTCKIRRVKCDEARPTCFRCRKFGIKCDGYNDTPPLSRRESRAAVLLPRTPEKSMSPLSFAPVSTTKFETQEDYQYFLHFRRHVTIDLSGSMPAGIWEQVIPRAGDSESALNNLILAVSAMDLARQSPLPSTHSKFAVAKYGKALRGIQEMIASRPDRYASRVSVIASLLIFAFENLQGETELATNHAKTALNFMRKQLAASMSYSSEKQIINSVPGLEDEVVDSLARWDYCFITTEYMAGERLLEAEFDNTEMSTPREFHNIHEVRGYLRTWQHRSVPYLPALRTALMGLQDAEPPPVAPPGHYEMLTQSVEDWFKALAPLFERISEDLTSHEFMVFALQKTSGLLNYVALKRAYLGPGADIEPQCLELTELALKVVQNPYYRRSFCFDIGVIEAMMVVCILCPNREICMDALRVLKLAKGRVEMMSNAEIVAARCEMVLQMRFPAAMQQMGEMGDVNF